ncbi:MAG: hypothetical protein QOJ79_3357 [Actinomycetota bacterium]|nr:hypothetical protein [Actinomycetota bacterium]
MDPLTGEAPRPTGSVVVVKVDNGGLARPYQRGLGAAAIVYQELVEAGETRFAAVFTTAPAGEVGPVRSVRESDIELLRQYGDVPVAFSGGNSGVKATFHAAVRAGYLLDASYDVVPQDYRLGERRSDARNFFTTPSSLAASRPGTPAHDIGLRFGPLPLGAGTATTAAKAVFSPFVTVRAQYVPETGRWAVFQNKREMAGVAPANVVIQRVPIRMSRYVDVLGNRTPYTVTTGSGPATVLRDGVAVAATWQRPTAADGTHFVDALGNDVPLRAGPTWVLLLPNTGALALG